jgi:hypothetical protein
MPALMNQPKPLWVARCAELEGWPEAKHRRASPVTVRSSFVLRVTRLATSAVKSQDLKIESRNGESEWRPVMNSGRFAEVIRKAARGIGAVGAATVFAAALAAAPVPGAATAAKSGEENRLVNYHAVDRAEIENLQRWVAAGHEDWCKDARLVAAEELQRIAADFAGDATELNLAELREGEGGAKQAEFEWTPLDGRATYRVRVERFAWLLPVAKDADAVIWVPTMTEIQVHK